MWLIISQEIQSSVVVPDVFWQVQNSFKCENVIWHVKTGIYLGSGSLYQFNSNNFRDDQVQFKRMHKEINDCSQHWYFPSSRRRKTSQLVMPFNYETKIKLVSIKISVQICPNLKYSIFTDGAHPKSKSTWPHVCCIVRQSVRNN